MINYQGELTTSYPLLFWQSIPKDITSITDMRGKIICVEPASAQDSVLSKYTDIIKLPTEKVDDALLNLQYGKCDAAFVESAIAKKFKSKYPQIQLLDVPLGPEDQVQGVGIAIKKENRKLIAQVEDAIRKLKSSGTIQQYEKKWGIA
jgi:ABC-type amino acid transport substrate-binding protein